jgi:hypothetical protein
MQQLVSPASRRRAFLWLGAVLRLVLFFFQDDKHADAPMRALIAVRLNAEPAARASTAAFCQYGPLPIEAMRPFLALGSALRSAFASVSDSLLGGLAEEAFTARLLSLVCGLLTLPLFARWAEDWVGAEAADLALLGVAFSPLALQLGTTSGSEALYCLLVLAAAWALRRWLARGERASFITAAVLFGLAAVTRFDAWIGLPAAALVLGLTRTEAGARRWRGAVGIVGIAATFPLAYLLWSASTTGDPFFFARFIRADHRQLGASAMARYGPWMARLRQIFLWLVSTVAAATPVFAVTFARLLPRAPWRELRTTQRPDVAAVLAFAWAPIALYVAQGMVTGAFEPLPRFALLPSLVLLPAAARFWLAPDHPGRRRTWLVVPALAILFSLGVIALSLIGRQGRLWGGAESLGAWTRLDREDQELAAFLRRRRHQGEAVFIDPLGFTDIAIAHAAAIPQGEVATLTRTRTPQRTLAATVTATGARWIAAHDRGWGREGIPDWPPGGISLGGWHVTHVDGVDGEGRARVLTIDDR